jgi:anthranilate phosphoribosyltransferase
MNENTQTGFDASAVLEAILHAEPTTAFLEATAHGLPADVLAELVRGLRASSTLPADLARVAGEPRWSVIDVCGTGGSKGSRLNTSTLTALFLPDSGVRVAKHGGRSASGKKGSLDLLESLGLEPAACYSTSAEALRSTGACFLGAAFTYGCFARYAPLRKSLGKPTLFNLLGPLLNPAPLHGRLLGCYSYTVQDLLACVLEHLGERGLLVCSHDDEGFLDEGAPWSETRLVAVAEGRRAEVRLSPREDRPARREELFADGVAAARSLLGLDDGTTAAGGRESASAARMVSFNHTLAVLAATGDPLAGGDAIVSARVDTLHADFLATLPIRVHLARRRLAALASLGNLRGIHPDSPVNVPSTVAAVAAVATVGTPSGTARAARESERTGPLPFPWRGSGRPGLLVAEVKRRTPTRRFAGALALPDRVRAYADSGADALSVVTHPSFGGDLALLREVRAYTVLPLLAKDFIRTPEEARALVEAGADGVLVLLDMLGEAHARALADEIRRLGATPFVESTFTLPTFGVPMLNSRNLLTLREGRAHRDALAWGLPRDAPFVVASSLSTPEEVVLTRSLGGAVVVGGALMSVDDAPALRTWIGRAAADGVLKACGAIDAQDARAALAAGAGFVGVNLIPRSKRRIERAALEDFLEDTDLLSRCVFLTDEATPTDVVALLARAVDRGTAPLEQCYFTPRVAGARGMFATSPSTSPLHSGTWARILDGAIPGSGHSEPYPVLAAGAARCPTLCAGGVDVHTASARMSEARAAGHAVCGIDAATGVERRDASGRRLGFDVELVARLARSVQRNTP